MTKFIGAKIREAREATKKSQKELADALGFESATAISLIESGERKVRVEDLEKIARFLDRDIKFFIGQENKIVDILEGGSDRKAAIATMIRESIASGIFRGSPYYYQRLVEELMPKPAEKVLVKALAGLFPDLPSGMEYMRTCQ